MPTKDPRIRRRRPGETHAHPTPAVEEATPAPPAPEPPKLQPRSPTDLAALEAVATMDGDAVAAAMAAYLPDARTRTLAPGHRLSGQIVRIDNTCALIDVGGKAEAVLDRSELPDLAVPGDRIDAFVVSDDEAGIQLTTRLAGPGAAQFLEEARSAGIPVEGKVEAVNAGGFSVRLGGDTRAFCPASQIDAAPADEAESYIGRTLAFRIVELRGDDVVVAHRPIAEAEAREAREAAIDELTEGARFDGVVTRVEVYGAFVKLPSGVEGMVHVSRLGNPRHAGEVCQVGDTMGVRVVGVEKERKRIELEPASSVRDAPAASQSPEGGWGTFADLLKR